MNVTLYHYDKLKKSTGLVYNKTTLQSNDSNHRLMKSDKEKAPGTILAALQLRSLAKKVRKGRTLVEVDCSVSMVDRDEYLTSLRTSLSV